MNIITNVYALTAT